MNILEFGAWRIVDRVFEPAEAKLDPIVAKAAQFALPTLNEIGQFCDDFGGLTHQRDEAWRYVGNDKNGNPVYRRMGRYDAAKQKQTWEYRDANGNPINT